MALLFEHTCEGAADEADVGTGAGFGTPWTQVIKAGAGVVKYDTLRAMHGTTSMRFSRVVSADSGLARHALGAAVTRLQVRAYVWMSALPTSQLNLFVLRHASGFMGYIGITVSGTTAGRLAMANTSNTFISGGTAAADFPLSQWVRVEAAIKAGTGTGDGTIEWAYYLGDSTTAIETKTITTANTGTANPIECRFGLNGSTAVPADVWFDDCGMGDGAAGWLGPAGAVPPTTVVTGGVTHLIDATGSSVPSGTLTYSIAQVSGTTTAATIVNPAAPSTPNGIWKVTPHVSDTLVYNVTTTGSLGGSDVEAYSVPPFSAGSAAVVRQRKTNPAGVAGGWV